MMIREGRKEKLQGRIRAEECSKLNKKTWQLKIQTNISLMPEERETYNYIFNEGIAGQMSIHF